MAIVGGRASAHATHPPSVGPSNPNPKPTLTRPIWEQRTSSYPSVVRCLLQTRDMVWYLLVQLDLVGDEGAPPST
mgnify:FL=1